MLLWDNWWQIVQVIRIRARGDLLSHWTYFPWKIVQILPLMIPRTGLGNLKIYSYNLAPVVPSAFHLMHCAQWSRRTGWPSPSSCSTIRPLNHIHGHFLPILCCALKTAIRKHQMNTEIQIQSSYVKKSFCQKSSKRGKKRTHSQLTLEGWACKSIVLWLQKIIRFSQVNQWT